MILINYLINLFNKISNFLTGNKTYITGLAMIVLGLTEFYLGKMNQNDALELIGTGLGFIFLRKGVTDETKKNSV